MEQLLLATYLGVLLFAAVGTFTGLWASWILMFSHKSRRYVYATSATAAVFLFVYLLHTYASAVTAALFSVCLIGGFLAGTAYEVSLRKSAH
jgi:glycerol-3-phosphate acyltransferase PlsY